MTESDDHGRDVELEKEAEDTEEAEQVREEERSG
jgi:hypothetical protein